MQIEPIRIYFFNDPKLPSAIPFLDLFLAANGIVHRLVMFVPNEQFDFVIFGEAIEAFVLVIANALPQSAGHTNIECSAITAGYDVNCGKFFIAHRAKPSEP